MALRPHNPHLAIIPLRLKLTLEFKWETYNATNHVKLANPNNFIDVTGAGQITAAADVRQMQFGLHLRF